MSKLYDLCDRLEKQFTEKGIVKKVDRNLINAVAKSLGPSIYNKNAQLVSCGNADERNRVKKNFLIKKLGLEDGPKLDKAIMDVCAKMGSSNRRKYRPIFYALLAKKFKMDKNYTD